MEEALAIPSERPRPLCLCVELGHLRWEQPRIESMAALPEDVLRGSRQDSFISTGNNSLVTWNLQSGEYVT